MRQNIQPGAKRDNPILYLVTGIMASFLGILLVENKLTNDVVEFDALTVACSDEVVSIDLDTAKQGWLLRRSAEKIRFSTRDHREAVLPQDTVGYVAARRVVMGNDSYCVHFDPESRTKSVYHVTSGDDILIDYAMVAPRMKRDIFFTFWMGIVCLLAVAPYYFVRYKMLSKTPD